MMISKRKISIDVKENTYLDAWIDETDMRPGIVIVPGGGYEMISETETEVVAQAFYEKGFQAFILYYSVNPRRDKPLFDRPIKQLSAAISLIRQNAWEYKTNQNTVGVCGFSAGGHIAACESVHWKRLEDCKVQGFNKPDFVVLSYPVISMEEYAHKPSRLALLGEHPQTEDVEFMSAQKWVASDSPQYFIWHSAGDRDVSVMNSLLFAKACEKAGCSYALHVFRKGHHGEHGLLPREGKNAEINMWMEIFEAWFLQLQSDKSEKTETEQK